MMRSEEDCNTHQTHDTSLMLLTLIQLLDFRHVMFSFMSTALQLRAVMHIKPSVETRAIQ